MTLQITESQLAKFAPGVKQIDLVPTTKAINDALARVGANQTWRRIRYFMSQSSFETQGYTKWEESLYYSTAQRLVDVFDTRLTMDPNNKSMGYAPDYIKNPQKLANFVYANRYGNGDAASGDGWNYRGRGAFHLTFLNNYKRYGQDMYGDPQRFVKNPDFVNSMVDKFLSAAHFWQLNGFNALADADSFTQMTKVINGSTKTVPDRLPVLKLANSIFGVI
jgi:putative chitinase